MFFQQYFNKIDDFLSHIKTVGYSPHSIRAYQHHLYAARKYLVKNEKIQENQFVKISSIEALRQYIYSLANAEKNMDKKKLSHVPQNQKNETKHVTRCQILSALRSYNHFILQQGYPGFPMLEKIKIKNKKTEAPTILDKKQSKELFQFLEKKFPETEKNYINLRNRMIFETLFGLGCRIAEIAELKNKNIDHFGNCVQIKGKGGKTRILPMTPRIKKIFKKISSLREDFIKKNNFQDEGYLLLNQNGSPITVRGIFYCFRKILRELFANENNNNNNFYHLHPHALRHSIATQLLQNGMNLRHIQKWLGHSSLSTTQRYTQLASQTLSEQHKRFHPLANQFLED